MNIDSVFADLDAHDWSPYDEDAVEIPDLLRKVASLDPHVSREALEDLCDHRVLTQGTVFPVTLPTVPYMARLAAAGIPRAPDLLYLLGAIAETDSNVKIPAGAARAAVIHQLPLLIPLLGHPEAQVRQLAVWAVTQCRTPGLVFDELLTRWKAEREPAVRADLLFGCVLLDPVRTRLLITTAADPQEPDQVRIAALVAGIDAGLPWTEESAAATLSLLPAEERIGQNPWMVAPLIELALRLGQRGEADAAGDLLIAAMSMEGPWNTTARTEARRAAKLLGDEQPESRTRLLPGLLRLLDDPPNSRYVMRIIRGWQAPAEAIVPTLLQLATGEDEQLAEHAQNTLTALFNWPTGNRP